MQTIQSNQLENGVLAPGNYKYYGTEGTGAKGFQDLDTSLIALGYTTSGGGLDVGDLFYMEYSSPLNGYSERQDYYMKYNYIESPSTSLQLHVYVLNGKGAPIMKGGVILEYSDTRNISINSSNYYQNLNFFHIFADGSAYFIEKCYQDYVSTNVGFFAYQIDDIDATTPVRTAMTVTLNLPFTNANQNFNWLGFDGTYYHLKTPSTYERYTVVGTTFTYFDTWIPPVTPTGMFIQGPYIYGISGNVMTKYDIVTGASIDVQYYGTRKREYDNGIWTNINPTGDLHAIFKSFSN